MLLSSLELHHHQHHPEESKVSLISLLYQQGLTQAQIAHKLKIHQSTVGRAIKKLGLTQKKRFRSADEERAPRYQKFRYCKNCKWIPIAKVITKKCNDVKYSYCPNCSSKMRENAKKSKLNHKRKNIKRL